MGNIRALIVDDSAFMRLMISEILSEHENIEVVGVAKNGEEALQKIKTFKPDVVTLDIEMPLMNGLEALKRIMEDFPVPVIMLSSTTKEGADNTFQAMQIGAFDFIAKPSGPISLDLHKIKSEITEKVIAASKASIQRLKKNTLIEQTTLPESKGYSKIESVNLVKRSKNSNQWDKSSNKIICIGTSTGGPRALQRVLTALPSDIGAAILVVQHMPSGFTKSLAGRLDGLSMIKVKEAEDGEIIQRGTAYIAPGGYHMKVKRVGMNLAISTDQQTAIRNGHRPSVDVMFESVSELSDYSKIAVIMTGMGSDGSSGLKQLKRTGNVKAIAESQETSIVFGMPKAAIATDLIDSVENVDEIARAIIKYC